MMNARRADNAPQPRVRKTNRPTILWVICLLLLLAFAFQGTRALWSTDEGRYTDNALQMIDSGNYLVPAYSPDRVNFSKPPMTYWVIAAAIQAFGHSTWAVRTPYALAFVLTALLLCAMGRRLMPDKPWLPGLIYGCALGPFVAANVVSTDVILTLFEALALFGFVAAEFAPGRQASRRYIWLMWLGFGLAFLTKGPPGLIALLAIIPFIVIRDGWRGLGRVFPLSGVGLFLVVGFSWYVAVMLRYPWLFHYFLHYEIYDRLFTATQHRHPQWYGWIEVYAPVFIFGTLPWWPALGRGLATVFSPQRWRAWRRKIDMHLFLVFWLLIPLTLFCLAQSRLPLYVLPLFQPLSLMLALKLRDRISLSGVGQRALLGIWVALLIGLKAGIGFGMHPSKDNRVRAQQLAQSTPGVSYSALAFVENTDSDVGVEEHTPWGMRLYTGKTIYGIAWRKQGSRQRICRVLKSHDSVLFAVNAGTRSVAIRSAAAQCGQVRTTELGQWRHRELWLIRTQNGA